MNIELGGPGQGCSAMRLRRFAAGELPAAESARVREHLQGCARCQATMDELRAEQNALRAAVPFDGFAAGVAEKLARVPARRTWSRLVPLAAAAGIVLAAGLSLRRADDGGFRSKGAASAQLFVKDARGVHALAPGEAVAQGAQLLVSLTPAGSSTVEVTLVEPQETTVLYRGPARAGPLPQAFEWTGTGSARVVVRFGGGGSTEIELYR